MTTLPKVTIGLDLGDRRSTYCVLTAMARVVERGQVPTDRAGSPNGCDTIAARGSFWRSGLIPPG